MTEARCAPEHHPPVDLVEVDETSTAEVVAAARAVCMGCPLLDRCSPVVKRMEVAGVAGALTEQERAAWRDRQRIHLDVVDLPEVTPARELTADILDDLPPAVPGTVPVRVRELVLRMTAAGMTADEIVSRLDRDDVTDRTVNYLRRTYMKGHARVVVS